MTRRKGQRCVPTVWREQTNILTFILKIIPWHDDARTRGAGDWWQVLRREGNNVRTHDDVMTWSIRNTTMSRSKTILWRKAITSARILRSGGQSERAQRTRMKSELHCHWWTLGIPGTREVSRIGGESRAYVLRAQRERSIRRPTIIGPRMRPNEHKDKPLIVEGRSAERIAHPYIRGI